MKILLTGGGTGGHITPLLAIARELKHQQPDCQLLYIGERKAKFQQLTSNFKAIDEKHYIYAGKFRRYHNESWPKRLTDIRTNLKNIRDMFFVLIGFFQAFSFLIKNRPNVIFVKGGFVTVTVGLAARILRIPYMTHDSDTVSGLANKIIAGGAFMHATGMPTSFYKYPKDKMIYTGIPISSKYKEITDTLKNNYRKLLKISENDEILLITGGSQGAETINKILTAIVPNLLEKRKKLRIIHQVGHKNHDAYESFQHDNLRTEDFIDDMYKISAAADIVVSRASMTTITELGLQRKAVIIIPNPHLSEGHQLSNAKYIESINGGIVLHEDQLQNNPKLLSDAIEELLDNKQKAKQIANNLFQSTKPDAAKTIVKQLLNVKE